MGREVLSGEGRIGMGRGGVISGEGRRSLKRGKWEVKEKREEEALSLNF